jgi:hypothetical protein
MPIVSASASGATVAFKKQSSRSGNKRSDAAEFILTLPPLKIRRHDINLEMLLNG